MISGAWPSAGAPLRLTWRSGCPPPLHACMLCYATQDNAVLRYALVCERAVVRSGAILEPGVLVSYGVVIGPNHRVPPHMRLSLCRQMASMVRAGHGTAWDGTARPPPLPPAPGPRLPGQLGGQATHTRWRVRRWLWAAAAATHLMHHRHSTYNLPHVMEAQSLGFAPRAPPATRCAALRCCVGMASTINKHGGPLL